MSFFHNVFHFLILHIYDNAIIVSCRLRPQAISDFAYFCPPNRREIKWEKSFLEVNMSSAGERLDWVGWVRRGMFGGFNKRPCNDERRRVELQQQQGHCY